MLAYLTVKIRVRWLYFWAVTQNELKLNKWMIPALATSYALMGWMIANQLNMLWLDAPIFLPLIISALYRLLQKSAVSPMSYGWRQ